MKENYLLKKSGVIGIIVLFICASFVPSISGYSEETSQVNIEIEDVYESQEKVLVTCSTFGFPGEPSQEITMSQSDAESLYDKIKELQIEVARDPLSEKTQQLQHEIITLADEHNLLPAGLSVETLKSRLTPTLRPQHPKLKLPRLQNKASEMFCNYVSTGSGSALPIIILPRLIPILLTPIPRLFVRWSTMDGVTSCGGLRSGTGFIAYGAQNGIALGFWGIGFSIFLPPVMAYGLFGYALYASVNAEFIEPWPPNYPPEVTVISPSNGAENVPVSTSELTFQIKDYNEDLMNYTVTTDPDVGSGSGSNIPGGTYSVPISGLEGTEEYTWYIQVNDGVNMVDLSSSFTTEAVAPIVSNPVPENGKCYVSIDLAQLSFHLSDPQGDLMDYTVETSPDIGSGSGSGVSGGTYSVNVGGLDNLIDYIWYVNVTDGTNWKHKIFGFQTEPKMVFNPFDEGWQYRKNITINHTKVAGDLTNFPVLVSSVDSDLRDKVQDDGDDILFMDGDGVATRLYHEIEYYDDSSGELVAWVNVTNLASNQDTVLCMYYGNPDSVNQQMVEYVWDSHFLRVYHLNDDDTSTTVKDSTKNYKHGTKKSNSEPSQADGIISYSQHFDNNDDNIGLPNLDENRYTIEGWFNRDTVWDASSTAWEFIYSAGDVNPDNYVMFTDLFDSSGRLDFRHNGPDNNLLTITDTWSPNTWYYFSATYDGSTKRMYINSYEENNDPYGGGRLRGGNYHLLGSYYRDTGTYPTYGVFDGKIDEFRISDIARSSSWVSTSHNNQNNPSSFLSFGPEETGP